MRSLIRKNVPDLFYAPHCVLTVGVTSWMGIQKRCLLFLLSFLNVCGSWQNSSLRYVAASQLSISPQFQIFTAHGHQTSSPLGVWIQRVVPAADSRARSLLPVWKLSRQQPEAERRAAVSETQSDAVVVSAVLLSWSKWTEIASPSHLCYTIYFAVLKS